MSNQPTRRRVPPMPTMCEPRKGPRQPTATWSTADAALLNLEPPKGQGLRFRLIQKRQAERRAAEAASCPDAL